MKEVIGFVVSGFLIGVGTSLVGYAYSKWKKLGTVGVALAAAETYTGKDNFFPDPINKFATIKYRYLGKNYEVLVPYDRSKSVHMLQCQVYTTNENGDPIRSIDFQPGVPILVTPIDLGVQSINVNHEDEDVPNHWYTGDIRPLYLQVPI